MLRYKQLLKATISALALSVVVTPIASASNRHTGKQLVPHLFMNKPSVNPFCKTYQGLTGCVLAGPDWMRLSLSGDFAYEVLGTIEDQNGGTNVLTGYLYTKPIQNIWGAVSCILPAHVQYKACLFKHFVPNIQYDGVLTLSRSFFKLGGVYGFYLVVGPMTNRVLTTSLGSVRVGSPIKPFQLKATGGEPYEWKPTRAVPGLMLDRQTGVVTGTPKAKGLFDLGVQVTNKWGLVATAQIPIRVM